MAGEERCVACHGEFRGRSKPLWAFRKNGKPAGRIHTRHAGKWTGYVNHSPDNSRSAAWFWVWVHHFRGANATAAEWDVLGTLMPDPDEPWGERHEDGLRWLAEGVNARSPEHVTDVRTAYHRLVEEFEGWRRAASREAGEGER